MSERFEVAAGVLDGLRAVCLALPEAYEEEAWVGTRWCVRKKNFAHVLTIDEGWPPAYARVAGTDGPATVLTFRSPAQELDAFRHAGHPFFIPGWWSDIVGMFVDDGTDWDEVAELVTESYCALAPKRLIALVPRR